jgi:hypothetical protein
MSVLYYYYYLFYTKILPDDEPHATVIFTLSFSESLLLNGLVDIVYAHMFCKTVEILIMVSIFVILLLINYITYLKGKISMSIVDKKPKFFASHKLSIAITVVWFLATSSFMFWKPIYVQKILDQCR